MEAVVCSSVDGSAEIESAEVRLLPPLQRDDDGVATPLEGEKANTPAAAEEHRRTNDSILMVPDLFTGEVGVSYSPSTACSVSFVFVLVTADVTQLMSSGMI